MSIDNKHCMIDIETLGNGSDAAIIQIGAVTSDGEQWESTIKFSSAMKHGVVDPHTLKWWMNQSSEAVSSVSSGTDTLEDALEGLHNFIKSTGSKYFWAHATFDFPILNNAFNSTGVKNPIHFRMTRDLRTIEHFFGKKIDWEEREGTHHTALDDARFQIKHLEKMLEVAENEY